MEQIMAEIKSTKTNQNKIRGRLFDNRDFIINAFSQPLCDHTGDPTKGGTINGY
jgi:hypothetical protein